ncbi:MAG: hypothetical protein IJK02_05055 [Clostridia bacterium]|nr:hypothetical protein [Clostridia bacterium]
MPIKEMPAFVFSHKNVLRAVIYSLIAMAMLLVQFILMKRNVLTVIFDVIIPFSAAVTFGCYAITMAMDRPVILIMPSTVYFISLLIRQLISIEVGAHETYPTFIAVELIPYLFYCISVSTGKLKKVTGIVLRIGCGVLIAAVVVFLVLAIFFRIMLTANMLNTIGMCFGMLAIVCIYLGMYEQLQIAGIAKRSRSHAAED